MSNNIRVEGRYLTAQDVADRLMPDLNINEALLWPPDLFAYTSYIMSKASAYQLVVSPPTNKVWPPSKENIEDWLHDETNGEASGGSKWDFWARSLEEWNDSAKFDLSMKIEEIVNGISSTDEWIELVKRVGNQWNDNLKNLTDEHFKAIDLTGVVGETPSPEGKLRIEKMLVERPKILLDIILSTTPPEVLACWAFFYREATREDFHNGAKLNIADLLCNQDHIQTSGKYCDDLWKISQVLLTMHAISDIASLKYGIQANVENDPPKAFAEKLLFGRPKGFYVHSQFVSGGTLSTFHSDRVRVLPKRHNPNVGITLRSISSNLAFHQSAVDVVWRKTVNNPLGDDLTLTASQDVNDLKGKRMSMLLLPFPLTVKTNDFRKDDASGQSVNMSDTYGFFTYDPNRSATGGEKKSALLSEVLHAVDLIRKANEELADGRQVDFIVFPETALSMGQFDDLQRELRDVKNGFEKTLTVQGQTLKMTPPAVIIAGVRESKKNIKEKIRRNAPNNGVNFPRNAVYCQYYDSGEKEYYPDPDKRNEDSQDSSAVVSDLEQGKTPKYKQYKHHRWQLNNFQIRRYGLTSVLDPHCLWWESIKIPKRRVSFLNVGDVMTISHLICEDLARLDPISELIRHVGPTLVVALLMDGPQVRSRWSARYATVLADDPGSSVITLTSVGMVKRDNSGFGPMSRVIALWNQSDSVETREIELAPGAEAVLLTLEIDNKKEKTADGRKEQVATTILKLIDVIQIYSDTNRNY